jgi:hypothetical protein
VSIFFSASDASEGLRSAFSTFVLSQTCAIRFPDPAPMPRDRKGALARPDRIADRK